jgi:hypothetical protein
MQKNQDVREMLRNRSDVLVGICLIGFVVSVELGVAYFLLCSLVAMARDGRSWAAGFFTVMIPCSVWLSSCVFMIRDLGARSFGELVKEPGQWQWVALVAVGAPVLSVLVVFGNLVAWLDRHAS